jgi:hypothetical protein
MLDVSQAELAILPDKLITSIGPIFDPDSFAYKFAIYTFGNFIFKPKFIAKLYNYASS